ncbi:GDSL-type esterase/lipase family protein [Mucilaginibacter sp. AK015]|uniref:GDSL-type esterase/lipase family protein n=1 Tax=Mucilaginibacter sp. AK015 TaxID=2723072 RepID=UPI00160C6711|nr:GDSL-type esterase/lipase family protein [Mucilaginibacter sp. AK015]MBB5394338.1 lysophospholipase L1-like esterase [Mucilaginibacter sp. AK015]
MKSGSILKSVFLIGAFLLCAFKLLPPQKANIVFIGDSITFGSNTAELQPSVYALDYLVKKKGLMVTQSNQGVSGHTTLDFLPGEQDFDNTIKAADVFYRDTEAQLIFSIMLGTNDSAMQGTHGAPVSPVQYAANLKTTADSLLKRYPSSKIVLNNPIYYSPNTYNGAMYLQEGLDRLQSYFPQIAALVKGYAVTNPNHVYTGYTSGFVDFRKNYQFTLQPEQGKQGTFYLHPNKSGAGYLGKKWGEAIYHALTN